MTGVGDNINEDIKGIWESMFVGWVQLTQDVVQEISLAKSVVIFRVSENRRIFFTT
jgi:hypothetical protein